MQSFALSMYSKHGLIKLFEGHNSNLCYLLGKKNIYIFYFGGKAVLRICFFPSIFLYISGILLCLDLLPILRWNKPFKWLLYSSLLPFCVVSCAGSSPLSIHPSLLFFLLRKIMFIDSIKEPPYPLTPSWMSVEAPI